MNVGDIFVYTYMYGGVSPYFVQIVRLTKSTVWFREIKKVWHVHDGYGQNGERIPVKDDFTDDKIRKAKIQSFDNGEKYFRANYHTCAFKWNGTPVCEMTD